MKNHSKTVILRVFWPLYRLLSIYDIANFNHGDLCTTLWNISKAISFSALIFSMMVAWASELVHCIQHSFHLSEMALQLAMMINLTSITITYVAIGMNKQLVRETVDRFQAIVNNSTTHLIYF